MTTNSWIIITPDFPPHKSGVAFFSKQLADHLTTIGQEVHVHSVKEIVPESLSYSSSSGEGFSKGLSDVISEDKKVKVFVQYTPKTVSAAVIKEVADLVEQRPWAEIWTFFHDLDYSELKSNFIARWWGSLNDNKNIRTLCNLSQKIFIPTQKWECYFGRYRAKLEIQPVPSNVPYIPDEIRAQNQRKAFAGSSKNVLCSFGSFSEEGYNHYLSHLIPKVLTKLPSTKWLVVGRHSERFREEILKNHNDLAERVQSAGELDASAISAHIQAADLIVQPYPDGVSTKRSSAMAALSHGKALITSFGASTEEFWSLENLATPLDMTNFETGATQIDALLGNEQNLVLFGKRAQKKYESSFSIDHLIQAITRQNG